jgi:pyruvate formate lyase activating enzyme
MKKPQIKGFVETSFCDWDGKISSVIFLPGCNLRCPFCQNGDLILRYGDLPTIDFETVAHSLKQHRDWIDGVVITGGEPTLRAGLPDLAGEIKSLGFGIKLDTNGTRPDVIADLTGRGLVDYIAMDLKAPLDERYDRAAGVSVDLELIRRSIAIIISLGDSYEFRTTLVPELIGEDEIRGIAEEIDGARRYILQRFVPQNSLDNSMRRAIPYDDSFVSRLVNLASEHVQTCFYRGKIGVGLS